MKKTLLTLLAAGFLALPLLAEGQGRVLGCLDQPNNGWIKSFFLYGNKAIECFARATGETRQGFYDISALETLSGVKIDTSGTINTVCPSARKDCYSWGDEKVRLFVHVNPEFVAWFKRMVVHPQGSKFHQTAKDIYEDNHRAAVRRAALSYRYLAGLGLAEESAKYKSAMDNGQEMLRYLFETYENDMKAKVGQTGSYEQVLDAGFWLRRSIDGSAPAIHEAMVDLLKAYDAQWYEENLK